MADCTDFPTPEDSKRFKNNAGSVDEFVTSDSDTFVDQDGGEHLTVTGIDTLAENQRGEIEQLAETQRDQFNATFQAQFAYAQIGNISDYVGDSLPESEKLNSYQYPDDSDNWYGPIQSQTFPITIPENPESDDKWSLVNGVSLDYILKNSGVSFETESDMVAGKLGAGLVVDHENGNIYKTLSRSYLGDLFSHTWLVSDSEAANGHTKLDLGDGLTAVMQGANGANNQFVQNTAYADPLSRFSFGMEYSYAIQNSLFSAGVNPLTFVYSGDSTTAGDAAEGFNPTVIMGNYAENYGVPSLHVNAGHSGQDTVRWLMQYVDEDIANNPNMNAYFVRWGINDGSSHGDVGTFESALRQGLGKLRGFKDLSELTVVLMSPNSTYDIPNNRDEKWFESIAGVIKKAARDFQCVYFDTYAMFRDSYNGAGVYMDDPFGDGRGIHPKKEFNTVIYNHLAHQLFGSAQGLRLNTNRFSSTPSGQFLPSENTPPSSYHKGISIFRATTGKGWPLDGQVVTEIGADGIVMQTLTEYTGDRRKYERSTSQLSSVWPDWSKYGIETLTYGSGWSELSGFQPLKVVSSGRVITLTGGLQNIGAPANSTIAVIPDSLRSGVNIQDVAANQNAGAAGTTTVTIQSDGQVKVSDPGDGTYVSMTISWVV